MQQQSRTLDIITGFQVLDGSQHLFVLEGLRDQAIKEVWETLPQPENSGLKLSVSWFLWLLFYTQYYNNGILNSVLLPYIFTLCIATLQFYTLNCYTKLLLLYCFTALPHALMSVDTHCISRLSVSLLLS